MWSHMKSIVEMILPDSFPSREANLYGQRGVTLIEMMVTISIMGVILSISWPALQEFVNSNRRAAVMNEFTAAFHY
ncbi:MAG TPA: prepilin-type N-terminal cleavage/methylation domain-containing protein, partial [Mariprofundaceae bacterium]|nr:prepilin-type N-terminal cleavage/methylation domain-containing protein [Mariprofundaceae bacterium]